MSKNNDKSNQIYSGYMRRAEQINRSRVDKMVTTGRQNRALAFVLTCFVGSVYLYSMAAVKQEKFLDQVIDEEEQQK